MRVAIRADAALEIGSGHVMRSLALAEALRERGASVEFVSRRLPGHAFDLVARSGFALRPLPGGPLDRAADAEATVARLAGRPPWDWLVVDDYGLDASWERRVRRACRGLLVLDDLADRSHDCDVLVDQNQDDPGRYRGLVPPDCHLMCGPRHAILRAEFAAQRPGLRFRDGAVRRVLVIFGGTDPTGETRKSLEALGPLVTEGLEVDVIVGYGNPHRDPILGQAAGSAAVRVHVDCTRVAKLMASADLSIGAAGTTTWERCCVGLPSLLIVVADNQRGVARAAGDAGAAVLLGDAGSVTPPDIARAVRALAADPARLQGLSRAAWDLTDGLGAGRVADALRTRAPA